MGVMKIQSATVMEAGQTLSGKECVGFFAGDRSLNVLTLQGEDKDHCSREEPGGWNRSGRNMA
jgi:hypothetical protein